MSFERKIQNGNKEYTIRQLSIKDEKDVQQLCEHCSDFFMIVEGRLPQKNAGYEILTELPPNKDVKDKFVFGIYNDDSNLIAAIDLIRNFKIEKEWTLGLMMIDTSERGKGLGKRLHGFVKEWTSIFQAHSLRIGVVSDNQSAYKFWSSLGYTEVDRISMKFGEKDNIVIVMNYCLLLNFPT